MEHGKLVAVVLGEPDLGIVELELEAVRRRRGVPPGFVTLRAVLTEEDEPARLVRRLPLGVGDELGAHLGGYHHQTVLSIACSTSSASQKAADRYFQPPSASTATTIPSLRSPASLRATWPTAPDETPAKIPDRKSTRLNSSHVAISYAVFCLK